MGNFDEIRNETKRLLREGVPTLQQYEEALPLCKELYEAFPETHELWDVQQYANCLKRLNKIDEAEQVCENIYAEVNGTEIVQQQNQAFVYIENLYAWILNDKYVRTVTQTDYQYTEIVLDKLSLLYTLLQDTKATKPSFSYCVLTVLKQLHKDNENIDSKKCLDLLNLITPSELTAEAKVFTDSTGKTREFASPKEDYYKLKSDFLLDEKQYEDCIICCNEAIETLERLHYDNDVWFSRKIANSLGGLGNIEEAISNLEKLSTVSDKWFLLFEIGKYYAQLNQFDKALTYMLRAVCTKDPEKMKVSLIEAIGDLLNKTGDISFAQDNYNYARQIRQNNDWPVATALQRKITEEKDIESKDIKKKLIQKLYQTSGSKQGKVIKLFNGRGGFIQADHSYYFQFKNFFGKSDFLKIGDYVEFIVINSYDKKKQVETKEAVVITPVKR